MYPILAVNSSFSVAQSLPSSWCSNTFSCLDSPVFAQNLLTRVGFAMTPAAKVRCILQFLAIKWCFQTPRIIVYLHLHPPNPSKSTMLIQNSSSYHPQCSSIFAGKSSLLTPTSTAPAATPAFSESKPSPLSPTRLMPTNLGKQKRRVCHQRHMGFNELFKV